MLNTLRRRRCEALGVPYDDNEYEDVETETEDIQNSFGDNSYPIPGNPKIPKRDNSTIVQKQVESSKNHYSASQKDDVIDFFSGFATIEDRT